MDSNSVGICIGASNIKVARILSNDIGIHVSQKIVRNHESNPKKVLQNIFDEININKPQYGIITGRKFRTIINTPSITEPEAIEYALQFLKKNNTIDKNFSAILSLGAETFISYPLHNDNNISTVETGNKCASGTGEFFMQQIKRMNIGLKEAVNLAINSEVYPVSGRCSVFCKSDCTHALNKGIPINRVTAGLCKMVGDKILDLIKRDNRRDIIAAGGVTKNKVIMDIVRTHVENLYIPEHADVFEAVGAAFYALENKVKFNASTNTTIIKKKETFDFLPPIINAKNLVHFKTSEKSEACAGDECIVGLDAGSTTTKAVIMRIKDNAILASVYLRTNGNPVEASRKCYQALHESITVPVSIIGLGTTGSGRQIAGLHASTNGIFNEIIAHATGAAYFDKDVDTIFEIGGQDAKYTYLTNSVPSDYAMNEACSAGTGSFLEESAQESMGLNYLEIADIALQGDKPPNFNDQCAAFISSDIKTASHESISKENIVAGLVYSICMNYTNRVKGQRPTGKKIFMQGGVCYNKAVPMAMATLLDQEIIVPPEPGLIGAFGIALEIKNRIRSGLLAPSQFDLPELANREIKYGKKFTCKGSMEKCDRRCEINIMIINGKKFTFGGVCNKYYNLIHHLTYDSVKLNYVKKRQAWVFNNPPSTTIPSTERRKRVGLSRSYLTNRFYPLYSSFFTHLGYDVVLSEKVDPEGTVKTRSSFCYPAEIAHGFFSDLLKKDTDYIFIPKIMGLNVVNSVNSTREHQSTCVLLQSEAYYLKSAFKDLKTNAKLLTPIVDFSKGFNGCLNTFISIAKQLGCKRGKAIKAYQHAIREQEAFTHRIKETGKELLKELEENPDQFAVVLFGRPYNAFPEEANMGIPSKFASRGYLIIPWDFLPFEDEYCEKDMCWAIGQDLYRAAVFVKRHPQLFGAWITNFSCGPDSFLLGYYRDIMKIKPSLTLELDSHTADAGINTRIEAFVDIVKRYREIGKKEHVEKPFNPAKIIYKKSTPYFVSSDNKEYSFYNPKVHLLFPSMGRIASELLASVFEGINVRSSAVPVYNFTDLKLGRQNALCKECLPLLLTAGGLLKYLKERKNNDEMLAYFMPFTPGNCRFPQYRVFLRNLIKKNKLKDVVIFSLSAEKGYFYKAFSSKDRLNVLKSFFISDVMEDIRNALLVLATNKEDALRIFNNEVEKIGEVFKQNKVSNLYNTLNEVARNLARIRLSYPLSQAKVVSLMGEIFVRRDYFSVQDLIDRLAQRDIIVKKAHFYEWLKYCDYLIKKRFYQPNFNLKGNIQFNTKLILQNRYERKIKKILSQSGLYHHELIDIPEILDFGKNFFDLDFRGESILVTGNFFKDMLHSIHGAISIGPFGCMPTRVIESILSAEATLDTWSTFKKNRKVKLGKLNSFHNLPFLSIETDGNPFPPVIEARIEAFCLQVERIHERCSTQNSIHHAALLK